MADNSVNDIDFEYWSALASADPEKFEELRLREISAFIEKAPSQRQQRLRGLQWQIDQVRNQHKDSSMASCLAISELMWETFGHLSELLNAQANNGLYAEIPQMQTNIIPFPSQI